MEKFIKEELSEDEKKYIDTMDEFRDNAVNKMFEGLMNDSKKTFVIQSRGAGKSVKFNQLMNLQKISDEIAFHKSQAELMVTNYNVLQDYYDQQLSNLNLAYNSLKDDELTQEHVSLQIEEVKEESNKQFSFINNEINYHKLLVQYWNHRLQVITIKELYGKKFRFCLYDSKTSTELPLFIFDTALEFEFWIKENKYDISKLKLDIFEIE